MLFKQHTSLSVAFTYIFLLSILNFMQPKPSYVSSIFIFLVHFFLCGMWYNIEMFKECTCFGWKTINYFSEHVYKESELFTYHYVQWNLWVLKETIEELFIYTVCYRLDSLQSLYIKPLMSAVDSNITKAKWSKNIPSNGQTHIHGLFSVPLQKQT